ncbi:MAG: diphosphate--fructose-6-phosphate 1-phosphotransferase, partial [Candidatus Gracilibacteria bacterium]
MKNIIIGQSGGPTRVINQSLVGAIKEAKKQSDIGKIFGMKFGIKGVLNEEFVDLREVSDADLDLIANTPGSALGSCRHKPTDEDCVKIFEVLKKHEINYWFYIGGNDSAETAYIVSEIAGEKKYDLQVFHIPKTVDNDLMMTDHCPGYGSAARYIAECFLGNDLDNRALKGVKIDIVMGRNAGWLTAASALAKVQEDSGPHLIYLPEAPKSLDEIVSEIDVVYGRLGRCVVAVSEGVRGKDGVLLAEAFSRETDAHGNIQLSGSG